MTHQSLKWIFLVAFLVACKQPGQNNPSSKEAGKANNHLRGKKKITLADIDALKTFDGSCVKRSTGDDYFCTEYYFGDENKYMFWGCSLSKNKCIRKGNRGYALLFDGGGMLIDWFPYPDNGYCQIAYSTFSKAGRCAEISQD